MDQQFFVLQLQIAATVAAGIVQTHEGTPSEQARQSYAVADELMKLSQERMIAAFGPAHDSPATPGDSPATLGYQSPNPSQAEQAAVADEAAKAKQFERAIGGRRRSSTSPA